MRNLNFKYRIIISSFLIILLLAFLCIFLFSFKKDIYSQARLIWQERTPYLLLTKKQHENIRGQENNIIHIAYLNQVYEAQLDYFKKLENTYVYAFLAAIPYDDETSIMIQYKNIPLIYFLILGGQI